MAAERILVTGAAGFVGRHLVPALLEAGHALVLPIRRDGDLTQPWRDHPNVRVIAVGDLATADFGTLLAGVSTVVHLAGLAHLVRAEGADFETRFMAANATVAKVLAEAAAAHDITTFVNLSSLAAITGNARPTTVTDTTHDAPTTPYGRSKLAGEQYVADLAGSGRLAISLRPPLIVGPEARGNWKSLQALAATGLPLPFAAVRGQRSFVSIQTLTDAIVQLCARPWEGSLSGAYCVADPEPMRLPDVLTALRAGMGLPPRLFPCPTALFDALGAVIGRRRQLAGLTGALRVDGSRFFTTFGVTPSLPLAEAIALSGKAYLAQAGASRRPTH